MTPFNWRVLSKTTLRSYELAAKDFETVTGVRIQDADEVSIAAYQASMEGRKLSVGTIRLRLSIVSVLSGVKVELPKPKKAEECATLSTEQVRALMATVTDPSDRMLLVKVLTLGTKARAVVVPPEKFTAHFVGAVDEQTLTTQKTTRKLKRYARRAGLNEEQINLRVWAMTGRKLMNSLPLIELVSVIGHNPEPAGIDWKPLHGIGRRSKAII